ncbi:unnamed protein product [Urochloa humidicola]
MAKSSGLLAAVVLLLLAGAAPPSDGAVMGEQFGMAALSGAPDGKDGACGYGENAAKNVPFMNLVAGFHVTPYDCGVCYRVTCISHDACSEYGVRVTVTDTCRAASCARGATDLFEMTSYAFDEMAKPGRQDELRAVGLVAVRYEWEDCAYYSPAFRVDPHATKDNFAVTVVFVEGVAVGNDIEVRLRNAGEDTWQDLKWQRDTANTWNFTSSMEVQTLPVTPPVSMEVTMPWFGTNFDRQVVTAKDVIPVGWQPGQTYYPLPASA